MLEILLSLSDLLPRVGINEIDDPIYGNWCGASETGDRVGGGGRGARDCLVAAACAGNIHVILPKIT